ncbi:MAG: hypothetical protein GX559_03465 [Candidatus Pacebacteria bacterium]|nr:hypothetical protein [Candidatus Paceibacterota bacterium]
MFNIAKKATKVQWQMPSKPEKKTQMGVSVIEVLIVVAIALLLMVALYRTLGNDVNKARDTDRKKALKEIKIAFENYYNDNDCYPPADSLENCGDTNLAPYLAQVPCDKLGQNYLYVPVANTRGATCGGYRVLTKLAILSDPMIEQVGCPFGCGNLPEDVESPESYNYGIAEGVPLNQNIASPPPPIDLADCSPTNECYCCNVPPGCNVYNGSGICNSNAYATHQECIDYTQCTQ